MSNRPSYEKVYGVAAARAVFARRPDDVVRISHARALRPILGELLFEAAARRIAYEEVSDEQLGKRAEAVHHEGICLVVRPRKVHGLEALLERLKEGRTASVVALDDVGNPHNVGAIIRTAAFFGIEALLVAAPEGRSILSPSAVRIAQGGAERVALVRTDELAPALASIAAAGIAVVGTDVRGTHTLDAYRWPARSVIVLGNEGDGIHGDVRRACTAALTIPGSGAVESLNVSVAAGVVLSAWSRGTSRG